MSVPIWWVITLVWAIVNLIIVKEYGNGRHNDRVVDIKCLLTIIVYMAYWILHLAFGW